MGESIQFKIIAEIKEMRFSDSLLCREKLKSVICVEGHSAKDKAAVYASEKYYSNQAEYVGKHVAVYINSLNRNEYYVDVHHIN